MVLRAFSKDETRLNASSIRSVYLAMRKSSPPAKAEPMSNACFSSARQFRDNNDRWVGSDTHARRSDM